MPKVKSKPRSRGDGESPSKEKEGRNPFYAVRKGKKPGVYESWEECSKQTDDFPDSEYKSFDSKEEALQYISDTNTSDKSDEKDEDKFSVYACGLSQFHGKKGQVAGLGVYFGPDHKLNSSERISGNTSLNRAQIQAAIKAAKQIKESGKTEATVYTDSSYVVNGITKWVKKWKTNGWKSASGEVVKNQEDFQELDESVEDLNLTWVHATGDSAPSECSEAKKLAQAALKLPLP